MIKTCFVVLLAAVPLCTAQDRTALKITPENAQLLQRLGQYPNLKALSISCLEELRALPDSIGSLAKLQELVIDNGNGCSMNPLLPASLGNLRTLEKLVLYGAQDPTNASRQPSERHKFPESLSQLKNLTYLDLGRNGLREIPAFVGDLPRLRELGFNSNELKAVPRLLANLSQLETLRLNANDLDDLPVFLNTLPKLTRITLGENCVITKSTAKKNSLKKRFPKVSFDFEGEYDCP